jgi:hypothetical protein
VGGILFFFVSGDGRGFQFSCFAVAGSGADFAADAGLETVLSRSQIILRLAIHPEAGGHPEVSREAQSHFSIDVPTLTDNCGNA